MHEALPRDVIDAFTGLRDLKAELAAFKAQVPYYVVLLGVTVGLAAELARRGLNAIFGPKEK